MADFTDFDNLSEDLKAKLIACSTPEEIIALAKSEGYEISSEQLESMAGESGPPNKKGRRTHVRTIRMLTCGQSATAPRLKLQPTDPLS